MGQKSYMKIRNQKKTAIILTAMFLLGTLSFTGCGKEAEQGQIGDADITPAVTLNEGGVAEEGTEDETDEFKNTSTDLKYDFVIEHIGRADISIPFPKGWKTYKKSDYNICFQAPADDPYFPGERIWFHSTLAMDNKVLNTLDNTWSQLDVREMFEGKIQKDVFTIGGKELKLLPSTEIDKVIADERIVKPEYQYELSYRDWDASVTPSARDIYHQDVTFYWRKIPCILSGMTTNEQADNLDSLMMYMMTNAVYVTDTISSVEQYPVFEGDTAETVKVCPLFEHHTQDMNTLNGTFENVASFICPMNSGTGYSQTNIAFYKIKENKWPKKITDTFFHDYCEEPFFSNVFGHADYMNGEFYGNLYDSEYKSEYDGEEADEYIYSFDVLNLRKEGYYDRQSWTMLIHTFRHDGYAYIVVTTHPEDAAKYAVEAYSIAAASFAFNGGKK